MMPPAKLPQQGDGPSSVAYPWTTNKDSSLSQSSRTGDDDDVVFRKVKQRLFLKRSHSSRLDISLSSLVPATLRPWILSMPLLPTFLFVYCLVSVLALSSYVYSGLRTSSGLHAAFSDMSVYDQVALGHLLSKASSLYPRPLMLNPNILVTPPLASLSFSACLWIDDENIEAIERWAAEWRGPISLLVATTATPSSPEHARLEAKFTTLQRKHPPLKQNLFVHLVHLDPRTELHPNSLLNLARLLAPSPRVVLFPGNLSAVPPKTLYRALLHQQPSSSSALTTQGHARRRRPAVLTSKERTSFPFTSLAPLVLARDDSTWCTERFFANMPRALDWEECLWQVWLANFGDIEVRQVPGISGDASSAAENGVTAKLHRRLISKFRSETCGLAIRRFAALRDPNSSADTKKARWLKRVCRSWNPS